MTGLPTESPRRLIVRGLLAGFGIEDVAVQHGIAIPDAQAIMRDLHQSGTLATIGQQSRRRARDE